MNNIYVSSTCFACNNIFKTIHIFLIAFFKNYVFCIIVTKTLYRINCSLFQISECNNISKCLCRIINTICSGKSLHKSMITKILIYKQSIQCRCIKSCQKHTNNNQKVYFLTFHSICKVSIIVLKFFTFNTKIGFEFFIIVVNSHRQEFLCTTVHRSWFKGFILNFSDCILFFIRCKRKNGSYRKRLFTSLLQVIQRLIIKFCGFNTTNCKHCIKPLSTNMCTMGFYSEII